MKQRLLTAALLALLLQGCQAPESTAAADPAAPTSTATTTAAPEPAPPATPAAQRPALPQGACEKTEDGFSAFLEAIVADPAVRAAYSAPHVEESDLRDPSKPVDRPGEPFRLVLIDSRWSYDEPDKQPEQLARVKLELKPDGERMRAEFIRAEFSPDEEVIKTVGTPEAYVFDYTQQCWQLTQHLR
ncbi:MULTISPECIES: hypothetical protein [Xanthomonas]|uniref:hypothetical protein n=1 Tax=Xanthomonas TaxID=338 RepID=UPI0006FE7B5E|nr:MULTISPECIES: hypothetical protein [Xanthomonas]KQR09094.1 hypothetical protein ASF90_16290 [Xanthomonas sp. Leaf148]